MRSRLQGQSRARRVVQFCRRLYVWIDTAPKSTSLSAAYSNPTTLLLTRMYVFSNDLAGLAHFFCCRIDSAGIIPKFNPLNPVQLGKNILHGKSLIILPKHELQNGISGLVLKLIFFSLLIILPILIHRPNELKHELDLEISDVVLLFIGFFLHAIHFGLSILLYFGADQKNVNKCRLWLKMSIFMQIFQVPFLFLSFDILEIALNAIIFIYSLYTFWLVYLFIVELNTTPEMSPLQITHV